MHACPCGPGLRRPEPGLSGQLRHGGGTDLPFGVLDHRTWWQEQGLADQYFFITLIETHRRQADSPTLDHALDHLDARGDGIAKIDWPGEGELLGHEDAPGTRELRAEDRPIDDARRHAN